MLAPKKMDIKKTVMYGIIMAVMFGSTGWMIYKNFIKTPGAITGNPAVGLVLDNTTNEVESTASISSNKTLKEFDPNELNFLSEDQFKQFKDSSKPIVVSSDRSNNPFKPNINLQY